MYYYEGWCWISILCQGQNALYIELYLNYFGHINFYTLAQTVQNSTESVHSPVTSAELPRYRCLLAKWMVHQETYLVWCTYFFWTCFLNENTNTFHTSLLDSWYKSRNLPVHTNITITSICIVVYRLFPHNMNFSSITYPISLCFPSMCHNAPGPFT